jgi:hypothetical protein
MTECEERFETLRTFCTRKLRAAEEARARSDVPALKAILLAVQTEGAELFCALQRALVRFLIDVEGLSRIEGEMLVTALHEGVLRCIGTQTTNAPCFVCGRPGVYDPRRGEVVCNEHLAGIERQ